jgi:hypothetical protein
MDVMAQSSCDRTGNDEGRRFDMMVCRPRQFLVVRETAAPLPTLRGIAATAGPVGAGERLAEVLRWGGGQRHAHRYGEIGAQRNRGCQAADEAAEGAKAPRMGVHGGNGFARKIKINARLAPRAKL